MPFCDKVYKGGWEGRPILPDAVWRFWLDHGKVRFCHQYGADDLKAEQWAERGRVRLLAEGSGMPPLASWKPPRLCIAKLSKPSSGSLSSGRSWEERQRTQQDKVMARWEEQQRSRRRQWNGPVGKFKERLDASMDDPQGYESTWMPIQAKEGRSRWCWTSRRLKGAVEVEDLSGEVFFRGSMENQVFLLEFVRQFTDEFQGTVPKMSAKTKQRLLPGSHSGGRSFWTGSGKGGQKGVKRGVQKGAQSWQTRGRR
mmetsp:Transcript_184541/g.585205  ORF Transcript_184541/g.585205 Transcript_184541/m.585205 type:complete len:255 (+) Transcript_184541:372-1136(+)